MQGMEENSRSYEDYTVAVVCAKSFDMSAVRYMLDQEHSQRSQRGDPNSYVLGTLSGHNVVIVCLPGTEGKSAAATVATNLARTFISIQCWFLVGTAGGVPTGKHDIRLGDVVVSMPEGQYGGVVQYDLGKDTTDDFVLKGFLWPSPSLLRGAAYMMQSDHLIRENKVDKFVSAILEKGPEFASYRRPPAGLDVLFEADYPHVSNSPTCEKCDKSKTIKRPSRTSEAPKIHYGLIASGDRVIKSAVKRDTIVKNIGDILCFEIEAAGLLTEYSSIVIRGISNYADSHKNDGWQQYAAAAAAACTKELLSYLNPKTSFTQRAVPAGNRLDGNNQPGSHSIFPSRSIQYLDFGNLAVEENLDVS
ncbi:purine and uridine phosphorylase [Camillea tinctor]|nr:purine and uridine phosphorylase [Camillea tinctor]